MKRVPKARPPMGLQYKDLKAATVNNNVIDINKVRDSIAKRKRERSEIAHRAVDTRRTKKRIADHFKTAYSEILGGQYEFHAERFVSYRTGDNVQRKKLKPDINRLWDAYLYIDDKFGGTVADFEEYLKYALTMALESAVDKTTKLVGFVTSDKLIDRYFLNLTAKKVRNKRNDEIKHRAQSQSRLFAK